MAGHCQQCGLDMETRSSFWLTRMLDLLEDSTLPDVCVAGGADSLSAGFSLFEAASYALSSTALP